MMGADMAGFSHGIGDSTLRLKTVSVSSSITRFEVYPEVMTTFELDIDSL